MTYWSQGARVFSSAIVIPSLDNKEIPSITLSCLIIRAELNRLSHSMQREWRSLKFEYEQGRCQVVKGGNFSGPFNAFPVKLSSWTNLHCNFAQLRLNKRPIISGYRKADFAVFLEPSTAVTGSWKSHVTRQPGFNWRKGTLNVWIYWKFKYSFDAEFMSARPHKRQPWSGKYVDQYGWLNVSQAKDVTLSHSYFRPLILEQENVNTFFSLAAKTEAIVRPNVDTYNGSVSTTAGRSSLGSESTATIFSYFSCTHPLKSPRIFRIDLMLIWRLLISINWILSTKEMNPITRKSVSKLVTQPSFRHG